MNRRKVLSILGLSLVNSGQSLACLWDTDTLADEIASQPTSLDLILGQIPHHGEVYYQMRVARILKQNEMSQSDLNDIAVAYVRLKQFKSAEKYLAMAIARQPNHYETLSNIGVTAKKQGDFKKGAEYIRKALDIKPSGHMKLGDWYLKALLWRQKYEEPIEGKIVEKNFLGESYLESFRDTDYGLDMSYGKVDSISRHAMMVRNDQSYADGFLVFGDYLKRQGNLHLSFLAHTRAMMLGHQNPEEIRRRRRAYLKYHQTFPGSQSKKNLRAIDPKPWEKGIARAEKMIQKGADWLVKYQEAEGDLLKGKTHEKEVTIKMVKERLLEKKIFKIRSV